MWSFAFLTEDVTHRTSLLIFDEKMITVKRRSCYTKKKNSDGAAKRTTPKIFSFHSVGKKIKKHVSTAFASIRWILREKLRIIGQKWTKSGEWSTKMNVHISANRHRKEDM